MSSISSLSFGPVIQSTIIIDTNPDHTRDQVTRRSLIELVGYVDSTPITWMKKIQYQIVSSTYATEFSALCTAIEEAQSLHYVLRIIRCKFPCNRSSPTRVFSDNLSIIMNSQNPATELSRKHIAIAFYAVRETVTTGIIELLQLK